MDAAFRKYEFPIAKVLPTVDQLSDFLHLDDEQHPAWQFIIDKLEEIRGLDLKAVGGYRIYPVGQLDVKAGTLAFAEGMLAPRPQVCGYLRESEFAALFLCTAGFYFTEESHAYNDRDEILESYLIDAMGSSTVENAMNRIQEMLSLDMEQQGLHISNRYSPGYCNWPLADQKNLFALIGDQPTPVRLGESCLMTPIKSVSGIIGIGSQMKKREYGCAICENKTCTYRRILSRSRTQAG